MIGGQTKQDRVAISRLHTTVFSNLANLYVEVGWMAPAAIVHVASQYGFAFVILSARVQSGSSLN